MRLLPKLFLSLAALALTSTANADDEHRPEPRFKGKLMLAGGYDPTVDHTRTCTVKQLYTLQGSGGGSIWIFGSDANGNRCDCAIYSGVSPAPVTRTELDTLYKLINETLQRPKGYLSCDDNSKVNVGAQTFVDLADPSGLTNFELGEYN